MVKGVPYDACTAALQERPQRQELRGDERNSGHDLHSQSEHTFLLNTGSSFSPLPASGPQGRIKRRGTEYDVKDQQKMDRILLKIFDAMSWYSRGNGEGRVHCAEKEDDRETVLRSRSLTHLSFGAVLREGGGNGERADRHREEGSVRLVTSCYRPPVTRAVGLDATREASAPCRILCTYLGFILLLPPVRVTLTNRLLYCMLMFRGVT